MERRLVIGMAGGILMTLLALCAPLLSERGACRPGLDETGCTRLSAAAARQTKG